MTSRREPSLTSDVVNRRWKIRQPENPGNMQEPESGENHVEEPIPEYDTEEEHTEYNRRNGVNAVPLLTTAAPHITRNRMTRALAIAFTFAFFHLPVFANDSSVYSFPSEVQERLQEVLDELRQVEAELRPIRQRAEATDDLAALKRDIENDVKAEATRRFDNVAETLERIEELQTKLEESASTNESSADENGPDEIRAELEVLRSELEPMIREVRGLPEVRSRIEEYEGRVKNVMREISSETEALIANRDALHVQFNRLQREALEAIQPEEAPDGNGDEEPTPWITLPFRPR